ncbi:MAG: FAD-dependent oxidoreductase, partial [Caulobacteraceae bacterium]
MSLAEKAEARLALARSGAVLAIVGAGIAGVEAAAAARKAGFGGVIRLFGEERELPYDRPRLSKEVLLTPGAEKGAALRSAEFYREQSIELVLDRPVEAVDRKMRRLRLAGGEEAEFTALVLAPGSRPRTLSIFRRGANRLHHLRDMSDALRLRAAIGPGAKVVLVGGGIIGLEVAAAAVAARAEVVMIEAAPRILGRAASPVLSAHLARAHTERG